MGTVACCHIFAVVVLLVVVVAVLLEEEEYRYLKFYRNRFSAAIVQLNNNDKNYHHYYGTPLNAQLFKNSDVESKLKRLLLINDEEGSLQSRLQRGLQMLVIRSCYETVTSL